MVLRLFCGAVVLCFVVCSVVLCVLRVLCCVVVLNCVCVCCLCCSDVVCRGGFVPFRLV